MTDDNEYMKQAKAQAAGQPVQNRRDTDSMDDKILDLEQVKKRIREALTGERYVKRWDEEQQQYETVKVKTQKESERLCNDQCVEMIMTTIDGTVNLNIAGSYLDKKDIEAMGRDAMYAIIDQIVEKRDDYDVESISDAEQIVSVVSANLKGAIKKAAGGRILKHGEETTERRIVQEDDDKDGGLLT